MRRRVVLALLAGSLLPPPRLGAKDEGCELTGATRVVAIGDVHGAYPEFLAVLRLAGLDRREGPLVRRQDPLRPDRRHRSTAGPRRGR